MKLFKNKKLEETTEILKFDDEVLNKVRKKSKVKSIFNKIGVSFLTFILLICFIFFGAIAIICYGPSPSARDIFVTSVIETSAGKFLAYMYFSKDKVNEILDNNSVGKLDEEINTDLVVIEKDKNNDQEDIVVEDVNGSTYKGKMMIIKDPSKVIVGVSSDKFYNSVRGKKVDEIIKKYNGVGGTNAGGFSDGGGVGNGGMPLGIVISEGKLLKGNLNTTYEVIGIDRNNKLILGNLTGQKTIDMGIRDAISFGPFLVLNNEPLEIKGRGSGLNPRTAIGQRSDGSILLLTIDGRQANSLGASMEDVISIMLKYNAVNAANLDGGSSTLMYYKNELISQCASLYGPRDMPTAIVVKE